MIQYQELLKTAKELEDEKREAEIEKNLETLDKNKWRMMNETRELIHALELHKNHQLDKLKVASTLTEIEVRECICKVNFISEILGTINT